MAKIENYNKDTLIQQCKELGIETKGKNKALLIQEALEYENTEITQAIKIGKGLDLLISKINILAKAYANKLNSQITIRKAEMKEDDNSHYLIYRILGITEREGKLIDEYQNIGRFLYKYAGSFLEEATSLCLKFKNIEGRKTIIQNNQGKSPKTFEIDFLDNNYAIEIKWRDATTDGDHITKEHTRVQAIKSCGYTPIRVMFFYPQRKQAQRVQETLKTIYEGVGGEYYAGDDAWNFINTHTGFNLKEILITIANQRNIDNANK